MVTMTMPQAQEDNLATSWIVCRSFDKYLTIAVLGSLVGQLVIDPGITNMISTVIATIASLVTFRFVLNAKNLRIAPLPTFCVFAFNIATLSGPLITQTLSFRALAYNLKVPEISFGYCAVYQGFLLITLFIFLSTGFFRGLSRSINRSIYQPLGFMATPAPIQLWVMGLVGVVVSVWSAKYSVVNTDFGSSDKALAAFLFMSFAPFMMPLYSHLLPGPPKKATRFLIVSLLLFFLLVLGAAVVRNSRGAFATGVTALGVSFLFATLLGQFRITRKVRNRIYGVLVLVVAVSPILNDFSTAMLIARADRGNVSSTELVGKTVDAFFDEKRLNAYREITSLRIGVGDYDEEYAANPFIQRFIQTKFIDNTLSYRKIREGLYSDQLWKTTVEKVLALMPTPMINALGLRVDKDILFFSMGDYFYYLEYGGDLLGFKLGSPIAHGLGLMGPAFFFLTIPLTLLSFVAIQSLTSLVSGRVIVSPILLLQFMDVWWITSGDSLINGIGFFLRYLPQTMVTYLVVFHITRMGSNFFKPRFAGRAVGVNGRP